MHKKIDTSKLSKEEKVNMLIKGVREKFPDATEKDFNKMTPRATQMNHVLRQVARELFSQSGDKTWLEIGRSFTDRLHLDTKPAAAFETK